MSVSGILSSIYNQYQPSSTSASYQKQLQQLGQALQSGNLSGAQSDFASLQQAFSQTSATSASPSNSPSAPSSSNPIAQAFNQLGSDLQSGNLSAAQKDFSTVEQDIGSAVTAHVSFRHHFHSGGGISNPEAPVQQFNPTSAQTAYAALQKQLQQYEFGGGGGAAESQATALQDTPPLSLVA